MNRLVLLAFFFFCTPKGKKKIPIDISTLFEFVRHRVNPASNYSASFNHLYVSMVIKTFLAPKFAPPLGCLQCNEAPVDIQLKFRTRPSRLLHGCHSNSVVMSFQNAQTT